MQEILNYAKELALIVYEMVYEEDTIYDYYNIYWDRPVSKEYVEQLLSDPLYKTIMVNQLENDMLVRISAHPDNFKNENGEFSYRGEDMVFEYIIYEYVAKKLEKAKKVTKNIAFTIEELVSCVGMDGLQLKVKQSLEADGLLEGGIIGGLTFEPEVIRGTKVIMAITCYIDIL